MFEVAKRSQRVVTRRTGATRAPMAAARPAAIREAVVRGALAPFPAEHRALTSKVCFDSVAYALQLAGCISKDQYEAWPHKTSGALRTLVNARDAPAYSPDIPAGYVIGIFQRYSEDGPLELCHVMLSLGRGLAIGSNNGCLGGRPDWSVHDLRKLLSWPTEGLGVPVAPREQGPEWAVERLVFCRPVEEAAARFAMPDLTYYWAARGVK